MRKEAEANVARARATAEALQAARQSGVLPDGADWAIGACVILTGLQGRKDLNSLAAEIVSWEAAKGRWGTKVAATGESVAVKPTNIVLASNNWALCSEDVPEPARLGRLRRLVRTMAADPTRPWEEGAPRRPLDCSYSAQQPVDDWQLPTDPSDLQALAHQFVIYGEAGEWRKTSTHC